MTFPGVLAMGKASLEKYAPLLKDRVKGKRPFSQSAVAIRKMYTCRPSLASVSAGEIEQVIDAVLEELARVEGGLVISDPEPLLGAAQEDIATHGDLYLSFACGYTGRETELLWVRFWYYRG
jgi:hypothetical protein